MRCHENREQSKNESLDLATVKRAILAKSFKFTRLEFAQNKYTERKSILK